MRVLFFVFCIVVSLYADKRAIIIVPDMHCPMCTTSVKKAIKTVEGIKEVSVKLDTKQATVVYDDAVDIQTILNAIKLTSYEGKVVTIE